MYGVLCAIHHALLLCAFFRSLFVCLFVCLFLSFFLSFSACCLLCAVCCVWMDPEPTRTHTALTG